MQKLFFQDINNDFAITLEITTANITQTVGGGQPQTCWNLPFGDGEKWGKVGKNGANLKLRNSCLEKTSKFILTVSLGTINHSLVYSNLKISTGAAIWANIYILSYSMTSLTEIFTIVYRVASWCICLIYVACQMVES